MKPAATPKSTNTLAAKLARLGLRTDADFIVHLPLRYEDETRITRIADARSGEAAQFEVEVVDCEIAFRPRRQLIARVVDDSGAMSLRFLNFYPNQQKMLQIGARLRVFGEVHEGYLGEEIIHPRFQTVGAAQALPDCLTPIYPTTAGLGQATLRRLIARALERSEAANAMHDTLPKAMLKSLRLPEFAAAIRLLHTPPPDVKLSDLESRKHPAWRRVQFDELLAQQLSLRRAYAARRTRSAPQLVASGQLTKALLASLPFELTHAQVRTWREIAADLVQPHPMQRLLQGDVGSGKTIVAALAMLQAVEAGYQAALMAPTEILAEQHFRKLSGWLEPLGLKVAWLTGSLKAKAKREVIAAVGNGAQCPLCTADPLHRRKAVLCEFPVAPPLVIGTHALIEENVEFKKLGLTIVDEQHRFGVRQRLALKDKGQYAHQLAMSATPIPRTLAMSLYADLDVSVLDELPPGRTPVVTKLVAESRRADVLTRVRAACIAGGQAYWVCPLIEESETLQLKTAEETFAMLVEAMPDVKVGLVHGRLKADAKAAVMAAFAANEIQLLVATTVIEVGVDVPNASLMVIEHAERFGLAQLHQLRGRVGRGAAHSACILLYAQPLGQLARARLKIIFENNDGFEIANQDLHLRGPGEFIGARQSGMPLLRYADLEDVDMVANARRVAEQMLNESTTQVDMHLARWLGGREDLLKA
ncbi:MAG: ATP-dependent DNA helicase RecG [Rhodocyclaceae bacterium]|nr:ATP-dependent DNA helicase RecG [Rhodocyclaceae bacterium]MBP6279456.1 ATP-dependent DNA helicase RecG [Rhodocyclaceae bacterium]